MDFQRPILIAAITAVSLMLLVEWNKFQQAEKPAQANAEQIAPEISAPVDVPTASSNNADTPVAPESAVAPVAPVVNAMA
ncbi:MAG TPA: membrane protein insertase YidC, partial [Pseudomonadales bacterium]|nr:membrane protein insertase YidC [Pseudomonadales bacterium]